MTRDLLLAIVVSTTALASTPETQVVATRPSSASRAWSAQRTAVFGNNRLGWVLVDQRSYEMRRLKSPPELLINEPAMAPDGMLVFTAFDPRRGETLLFSWNPAIPEESPRSIGDSRGYHSNPFVTPDGQWVYFAHNPDMSGPPGSHQKQAFAQIYRVHLDGTGLEALTKTPGCHFGVSAAIGLVAFVHMTCGLGGRWLEVLKGGNPTAAELTPHDRAFIGTDISPDGKTVLLTEDVLTNTVVTETRVEHGARTTLFTFPRCPWHLRARYGGDAKHILFMSEDHVRLWQPGKVVDLGGVGAAI